MERACQLCAREGEKYPDCPYCAALEWVHEDRELSWRTHEFKKELVQKKQEKEE